MAFFDRSKSLAGDAGQAASEVAAPATPVREVRAQAVHRLQVGLFGLAMMLLLVGLANIIMDRAQLSEDAAKGTQAATSAASPSPSETAAKDPLVDMGVAPELPVAEKSPVPAETSGQ